MEKNIKIVHLVLGKANPNRMNGINKVVYYLANAQSARQMDVSVWGITPDPQSPADYQRSYLLQLFPSRKFSLDDSLKSAILNLKGQAIFHIHGGFVIDFYLVARLLEKLSIPFIYTPHGAYNLIAMKKNYWVKKIYFPLIEKKIIAHAKSVHLIGQSEKKALESLMEDHRISLIPNGQFSAHQPKNNFTGSKPVFGFMGRVLIHTKGLDLLLAGFQKYKQNKGMGVLWILGDGKELPKLKLIASNLGIDKDVEFHGAVYGEEKENLMSQLAAFYHTSRNEGMPGAVLEAAALGIPCVVSQATNVKEYIVNHNAGIGLAENNADHIQNSMHKIERLLESKGINKLSLNARQMISEDFSWDNIANQMIQLYAS